MQAHGDAPRTQMSAEIGSSGFPQSDQVIRLWREDQKWPRLLMHHSGKAWGPWPMQRGDSPPCSYCSCASSPCQSTETNRAAHPCASAPLVWSPQAWRLVTITCPEQNLKTTSLPSACSLKVNIFSLTLCRDLRCSSSVPLSLMAWIHAEHARTWHRAGAHLGAGEETAAGGAVP